MYSHPEELHLSIESIQEENINAETYRNIQKHSQNKVWKLKYKKEE